MVTIRQAGRKNMKFDKKSSISTITTSFLFIFMIVYALTGVTHAANYKIGITPWAGCSPFNIADAKGFWSKNGIHVNVISFGSSQEMIKALKYKRVHIIYQMMGTFVDLYMKGVPVEILAELCWSDGGDKIIVKKEVNLASLKQEKFGLYLNDPAFMFFAHKFLSSKNLESKNFQFPEMGPESLVKNFISGKFKVIAIYDPYALDAEKKGNGNIVATTADFPGCMPEGIAARTDVLTAIPDKDMRAILGGLVEAVKWLKDEKNKEEFKKILNSRTFEGYADYPDAYIELILGAVKIHDPEKIAERNKDNGGLYTYLEE